jgi:tRNA G46 methylase TrmB
MRCEDVGAPADGRLVSPSAQRNREPIAQVLCEVLPQVGVVLEVSSGTGQHVVHFARSMPGITWQPSERDAGCLRSISEWLASEQLANVRAPLHLDVHDAIWPLSSADAIVCINMIHIAPWTATRALMRGAGVTLGAGGLLYLYGP